MSPTSPRPGLTALMQLSRQVDALPRRALEDAIIKLGCLPLKRYCQITGETSNAVYQRLRKEVWKEGIHAFQPDGSAWWIDLVAVRAWVVGDVVNAVASAVRNEELERQAAAIGQGNRQVPDGTVGVDPVA